MNKQSSNDKSITRRSVLLGGGALIAGCANSTLVGGGGYGAQSNSPKRVFFAMLAHETNSFSPMASGMDVFQGMMIPAGELTDVPKPTEGSMLSTILSPLYYARKNSTAYNWQSFQGLLTYGAPGGLVPKDVYEKLRDQFIADLKAVMPIDIVALMLHGAMVAEGYDNCEADLFKHIRQVVGKDAVVGSVFDSHAHLGPGMMEYADLLIVAKEYPHTDFAERSEELIDLLHATVQGKIKPVSSAFSCRMIDMYHTPREPMRSFVDKLQQIERDEDDVLSISVFHSFPWADTPVMGTKILVITDNNPKKGEQLAEQLGRELFSMRGTLAEKWLPMNDALDQAMAVVGGPVVMADAADNPGGGAPCDSTFILQALIDRGIRDAVFGRLYDPEAMLQILTAREGTTLRLKIGGKLSQLSGKPVDQEVLIRKVLRSDEIDVDGGEPAGYDAAWLEIKGIDVIVSNSKGQVFRPEEFSRLGVPILERKLLIVKSSQHFYAGFASIAKEVIYADTPGVLTWDITVLPFKNITRPLWPLDKYPFG